MNFFKVLFFYVESLGLFKVYNMIMNVRVYVVKNLFVLVVNCRVIDFGDDFIKFYCLVGS